MYTVTKPDAFIVDIGQVGLFGVSFRGEHYLLSVDPDTHIKEAARLLAAKRNWWVHHTTAQVGRDIQKTLDTQGYLTLLEVL